MNRLADFKEFMQRREAASAAYVDGDPAPLRKIATCDLPATFFSPAGDFVQGAQQVASRYAADAQSFDNGSDFRFEVLQMAADGEIAYWVGLMRGKARMRGKSEAISMNLRVTEVFRREDGDWKLVHRHADLLSEK
ncbi:MAG TPA: nuclear transport factor 2 family protein [Candidatus Baltobacteraceae bacterium]|nr:nuclear transport factor 2 family protein [Candidatus Baltobacteraceae bacterium]